MIHSAFSLFYPCLFPIMLGIIEIFRSLLDLSRFSEFFSHGGLATKNTILFLSRARLTRDTMRREKDFPGSAVEMVEIERR